jgi:hypothetical protein
MNNTSFQKQMTKFKQQLSQMLKTTTINDTKVPAKHWLKKMQNKSGCFILSI